MYKIEKNPWGYKLTFADFITADEMAKWVDESKAALAGAPSQFGIFVDMRTLKPLDPESQKLMQDGQKLYKGKGMQRSVVILANSVLAMQFKRIGKETGIYEWERYIDASKTTNFEQVGLAWLKDGVDPDN